MKDKLCIHCNSPNAMHLRKCRECGERFHSLCKYCLEMKHHGKEHGCPEEKKAKDLKYFMPTNVNCWPHTSKSGNPCLMICWSSVKGDFYEYIHLNKPVKPQVDKLLRQDFDTMTWHDLNQALRRDIPSRIYYRKIDGFTVIIKREWD